MKKRCIDVDGNVINHHPKYYEAVNAVQEYLVVLESDDIDRSDILVCIHLMMKEAEFCWRFRTGPAKP
jgi:hypothetical protein